MTTTCDVCGGRREAVAYTGLHLPDGRAREVVYGPCPACVTPGRGRGEAFVPLNRKRRPWTLATAESMVGRAFPRGE